MSINARCPECGADFEAPKGVHECECPSCKATINVARAEKYFLSVNENASVKEAHGEDYGKVNMLIAEAYDFVANGEYENAEKCINDALVLTDSDYRVYMAMVAVKTKNYTDLEDDSHKIFLNKAINFADSDGKKEISETYKPYYMKRNLTEEELKNYNTESVQQKKKRLETSLKNMIPEYMAQDKRNKVFLILFPILFAISAAVFIISIVLDFPLLSLVAIAVVIAGYVFFRMWFIGKEGVKTFNSLLDLYDIIDSGDYNDEFLSEIYDGMQKMSNHFADKDPILAMSSDAKKLVDCLTEGNSDSLNEFLANNKYFSQFIE